MPNVMGRDFPYTPEGMTAAQQYSQAMGMRDGGPMGFRPVSYANGGPVQGDPERSRVINALAEITGLPPENFSELSDAELLDVVRRVTGQQPQQPQAMPQMGTMPQMEQPMPPMPQMGTMPQMEQPMPQMEQPMPQMRQGGLMSLSPR